MNELDELIDIFDLATSYLISGESESFAECTKIIVNKCFAIFPKIIVAYSDEKMSDMASEANYWPNQLERIMNVLDSKDLFSVFDILYNETQANLMYIKNVYEERGILL